MEWFQSLLILSLIFIAFASFQFYQFWKHFKKLKIGDKLSKEFVNEANKKLKIAIIFLGISLILCLTGVLIKPY